MRDTSDMMEDALSEDTMMDCGDDDGGLEDLVDLATDIADSSPTIRDAAERLLTLLGVDENNEDLLSSSEDEGVEVDVDEIDDEDEDEDEVENSRLLHQLAASLAQELKYSQQKSNHGTTRILQGVHHRSSCEARDHRAQSVEMMQDTDYFDQSCLQNQIAHKTVPGHFRQDNPFGPSVLPDQETHDRSKYAFGYFPQDRQDNHYGSFGSKEAPSLESSGIMCLDRCLRMDDAEEAEGRSSFVEQQEQVPDSWGAGWDACAAEALRYLMEDEGLPPHHPTVLAMKNHLDLQRERAFSQYAA